MTIRSDRLRIIGFIWSLGAIVFWRVALFVALVGAGSYALIAVAAFLLGFEALPWFRLSAVIWAPSAVGVALGGIMRQMREIRARAGRPPDLELVAGWKVGGLAMSEKPEWLNTGAAIMVMAGMLAANLAPPALASEFVDWIMNGDWPGITFVKGLVLPFSLCLFVAGLMLSIEGLTLGERCFSGKAVPIF